MDLQLDGKHALVTGSSSGIGRGIATVLAREGFTVVVHGRNRTRTESEVGTLAAFLASPLAAFVNGADYRIDGGQVQSVNQDRPEAGGPEQSENLIVGHRARAGRTHGSVAISVYT